MARMPTDSIVFWPYDVTAKAIPADWSRDTAYNDRFFQGDDSGFTGAANGGAANHTHTSPDDPHGHTADAHTHDVGSSPRTDGFNAQSGSYVAAANPHSHAQTASSSTVASIDDASISLSSEAALPPYTRVVPISPDDGNQNFPDDGVCFTDQSYLPGFDITAGLDAKYVLGSDEADGSDGGDTGGSATHTHTDSHYHTAPAHTHAKKGAASASATGSVQTAAAGGGTRPSKHHDFDLAASTPYTNTPGLTLSAESNHPAYIELLGVTADGEQLTAGMIVGFKAAASSIPSGWRLCDGSGGTLDCTNSHVLMTDTPGDVGNTGGSNTHSHTIDDHSHILASHNHTVNITDTGSPPPINLLLPSVGVTSATHVHSFWSCSTETADTDSASLDSSTVDKRYQNRTVVWIQKLKRAHLGAIHKTTKRILVAPAA